MLDHEARRQVFRYVGGFANGSGHHWIYFAVIIGIGMAFQPLRYKECLDFALGGRSIPVVGGAGVDPASEISAGTFSARRARRFRAAELHLRPADGWATCWRGWW